MKQLFLTSSAFQVIPQIVKQFNKPVAGLKVAFITTASETEKGDLSWMYIDKDALIKEDFDVFDYTLTGKTYEQVSKDLKDIDVLFVAGGNTFFLLEQANKCHFTKIVDGLMEKNVVYIGSSAGSLLACKNIEPIKYLDDPNKAPSLENYDALGLVDFILFPHWGSERFKQRQLLALESVYLGSQKIILIRDNQYIYVVDDSYQIGEI